MIQAVNMGMNKNLTMWKYYKIVSEEKYYLVIIADDGKEGDLPKWMFGKRK